MPVETAMRRRNGFTLGLIAAALLVLPHGAGAQDTLKQIKQKGTVTVGTEAAFPPFEYVQDGKIVGYGKDILDHVVAGLGVKLNQLDVPYQGIMPGLLAAKFDFVATSMLPTPERRQQFGFTIPIADGTMHVLKRKGDTSIKHVNDLAGKRVGTQLGTAAERDLRALEARLKGEGKPAFQEMKLFTAMPEAYLALANGQIVAAVAPLPSLAFVMKQRPGVYEILGPVGPDKAYFSWITRKDDKELLDFINARIQQLKDSGKLAELQQKWFGMTMSLPAN
jgi:polar amino acid transport system substrate-binding protein